MHRAGQLRDSLPKKHLTVARKGEVLYNILTGERILWLETAQDTGGLAVRFDLRLAPGGQAPLRHRLPQQKTTFRVRAGIFKVECDGKVQYLTPGDTLAIKEGKPHQWWNESKIIEIQTEVTLEPALNFEEMMEQIVGICNAQRVSSPFYKS